jgi:hypothetical protein
MKSIILLVALLGLASAQLDPNVECFKCKDRHNQKGLYANPADCHTYFQCFFLNATSAIGFLRKCPAGTFFRENVQACMPEGPVPCQDLCMNDTVAAVGCYASPTNCATYYVCSAGVSYQFCCWPGSAINPKTCVCEESTTCTATCVQPTVAPTTVKAVTSNNTHCIDAYGNLLSPVPGHPEQYYSYDVSDPANPRQFTSNCAAGTTFEMTTCQCSALVSATMGPITARRPPCLLYLNFNKPTITDTSVNNLFPEVIGNASVDLTTKAQGAGSLRLANGRIEIAGLQGIDLGRQATFCTFFRCESGQMSDPYACIRPGGLISNRGCLAPTDYSFVMSANSNPTTKGRVDTQVRLVAPAEEIALSNPVTASSGFNSVCFTYNASTILIYINGQLVQTSTKTTAGGSIAISQCPYTIGADQIHGYFSGHMDEVLICPVALTPAEVTAYSTGNIQFLVQEGLLPPQ